MIHTRAFTTALLVINQSIAAHAPTQSQPPPSAQSTAEPNNDADAPTVLIDRAAALLSALGTDAADDSVLLGLPTHEQRKRASETAANALAILNQADTRSVAAIKLLEDRLMGINAEPLSPDEAARIEASLARLVDVEQAQRIPLLRGLCHALLSGAADDPARAESALAAISGLSKLRVSSPVAEATRRLALAGAILRSSPFDQSTIQAALREIEAVRASTSPEVIDRCARRAAAAMLVVDPLLTAGLPAISAADAAEFRARGLIELGRRTSSERTNRVRQACEVLLRVLRPASDGTPVTDEQRVRTYARLASVLDGSIPFAELPAEAAFARALTLLREKPESAEAEAILRALHARSDLDPALRPEVEWERLVMLSRRAEQPLNMLVVRESELESLIRFAEQFPSDRRAAQAADRALAIAESAVWKSSEGSLVLAKHQVALNRLADHALMSAPTPDRVRAALIRRKASLAQSPSIAAAAALMDVVGQLPPADQQSHAPEIRAAIAGALRTLLDNQAQAQTQADIRALTKIFLGLPGERTPAADLLLAESYAQFNDRADLLTAAELYKRRRDHNDPRTTFALASILRRIDDHAGAVETLRTMVDRIEASAVGTRPAHYWLAWAEILEILQSQDSAGQRTADIRAQIKRLELLDPTLGGPESAARIHTIRKSIK